MITWHDIRHFAWDPYVCLQFAGAFLLTSVAIFILHLVIEKSASDTAKLFRIGKHAIDYCVAFVVNVALYLLLKRIPMVDELMSQIQQFVHEQTKR
jgi:hypothetical protein